MPRDASFSFTQSAIVAGAGFGGIAAALRLRAKGYDVHLIDRSPPSGRTGARFLEKDGFRHDAGPTVLTAPHLFEELFALFGKKNVGLCDFGSAPIPGIDFSITMATRLITARPTPQPRLRSRAFHRMTSQVIGGWPRGLRKSTTWALPGYQRYRSIHPLSWSNKSRIF